MNCFLRRPKHIPRLRQHNITRTSATPTLPLTPPPSTTIHAAPTAPAAFSSATTPRKLRPGPCPRAYVRYLAPLPNYTSIFASPFSPLVTTTYRMSSSSSSSSSHLASTPPAASSTPLRAPPLGPNHDTDADARHTPPLDGSGSGSGSVQGEGPVDVGGNGGELPALPAPSDADHATTTLEVDGKAVVLDHLGPMVVGRDGTVSRIANWNEMSEIERRNTLRVLGKRNQVRLAALRGEDGKAA